MFIIKATTIKNANLGVILFICCYTTATSSVKDSTYFEIGFNVTKSKLMYYKTGDYNVFLQDVPASVGQENYFDEHTYRKYKKSNWPDNTAVSVVTNKPEIKEEKLNFNIQIKYKRKKLEIISYISYLDETMRLGTPYIKNESIRDLVYNLNPGYIQKYNAKTIGKPFWLAPSAFLSREDLKKISAQFFYLIKIPIVNNLDFGIWPGVDFQMLLNQTTYYALNEYVYNSPSSSIGANWIYYKKEQKYFKPYKLAPLINATISYKLFSKFSINANAIYQIRPVWQNQNTLEVIKTSRIGAGVGLSYIIDKKKCKTCPTNK